MNGLNLLDADVINVRRVRRGGGSRVFASIPVHAGRGLSDRRALPVYLVRPEARPRFDFGCSGPGATNLAYSIVAACCGDRSADVMHGEFIEGVLSRQRGNLWKLRVGDVREWAEETCMTEANTPEA